MSYTTSTVAKVMDEVNRSIFLPAIQRPYVWEPEQIISLFDSLLKGYPISSFLFWSVNPDNRTDWEIYKFFENFKQGDTHNELIEPDGRKVTLVLDGQQRLTSLMIGLRGSYTVRKKYARANNAQSWIRQRLYLDLMKAPNVIDDEDDSELGVTYGLRFFESEPTNDGDHHWFKLNRIMACTSDDTFEVLSDKIVELLPDGISRSERRTIERNLDRLYRVIWKDEIIASYTEMDQSLDRVLDIFIRANDGGTKLSKSDLLLSMVTSKWKGISARQEIFDLVDHLNDGLGAANSLSKDFVMKACLVLSDLDVRYKVNNFTNDNLATIEKLWPSIKLALERTLRLANRFGIDKETLSSTNALMPIAYYIHRTDSGLDGSSSFEARNAARVHRFLIGTLLNGVFNVSSDTVISGARDIIRDMLKDDRDFPIEALVTGLGRRNRMARFDADNTPGLFDETSYGKRTCFLALSLIYDTHNWGMTSHHIDHIIPRSLANPERLREQGVAEEKINEILASVDRLGNLEILMGRENLEKNDTPFDRWITTRDPEFLARHLIPDDAELWKIEKLPEFVKERERRMAEHVRRLTYPEVVTAAQSEADIPLAISG